jgi:predicted lipoprotein
LGVGALCWFFPVFHIRKLGDAATRESTTRESNRLQAASGIQSPPDQLDSFSGAPIMAFWDAFEANPSQAQKQYGQQSGLGGAWYYCLQGEGTVQAVDKDQVILTIVGSSRRVRFELGIIVDSTVREAVGVKASQFTNSQDFNAYAADLNRQVEQQVISPNRELLRRPGTVVHFTGCAKISGRSDLDPLSLVPIRLAILSEPVDSPKK